MVAVIEVEEKSEALDSRSLELPPVVGMLERAEEFQRLISSGSVADRAELARRYGLTRARVTQLMNLLKLHPVLLAYVRSLPGGTAPRLVTERKLRGLTHFPRERQLDAALGLLPGLAEFMGFT